MRLPTGSKIALARQCSYPWSPLVGRLPRSESSPAAEHGTAVHALAEAIVMNQPITTTPETAPYEKPIRDALAELRGRFQPTTAAAEVPVAFDCETGAARRLPRAEHRNYTAARPSEMTATIDLLLANERSVMVVGDWKTGRGARETATRDSWQMLFTGLVVARIYRLESVTVAQVHLEPGEYQIDQHNIDSFDIDNIEDEIRSLYREVRGGQQTPHPGPHCYSMYCPARTVCPATTATMQRVNDEAARHLPAVATIASDEQAARVRVGLKLVEEHARAWKAELERYLRSNGAVHLGDDKYLGIVEESRELVSLTHDAAEALRAELGDEIAREVIEVKTSKSAIEDACKARQTRRGDGMKRASGAMQMLRDMGATKVSTYTKVSEFTRKEEKGGEAA